MKMKIVILLIMVATLFSTVSAIDWNGRLGFGLRGPFVSPMTEGESYNKFSGNEPFMLGWSGELDIKYKLTRSFVLGLAAGYSVTFDHPFNDKDQSFNEIWNKTDTAPTKLTGMLVDLEGQYLFFPEGYVQPYILGGVGADLWKITTRVASLEFSSWPVDNEYSFLDLSAKIGAGINFWVSHQVTFDMQVKYSYGLTNISADDDTMYYGDMNEWKERAFQSYFQPSIGLTYYLGVKIDTDKDGVEDKDDSCPSTPLRAIVDHKGCPLDSDGDGVYDGLDNCAGTPSGAVVDIQGCPLDSDGDGVYDGLDQCPKTPTIAKVDSRGCPIDTDRDGVPDYRDKEMDTPFKVVVDDYGIALDSDYDGVYDGLDRCPTTAAGTKVDEFGCPIEVAKPVEKITLNIKYATGSAEPDDEAKKILDELAETMFAYVDYVIEVDGFTDNVGSEDANQSLSQKRADAVMKYLLDKGVEPFRISARGFGENPRYFVGDNTTPEGRQKNRRVEIISIQH